MMDFDNWWKDYIGSDTDKSLELGSTYAKRAWNQQQKRIAELTKERELIGEYLYKDCPFDECAHIDIHVRASEYAGGEPSPEHYYLAFLDCCKAALEGE